jgi:uncharacterized protein YoxC
MQLINDRTDLYTRQQRVKFELLVCRLVQFSQTDLEVDSVTSDNLQDIVEQWFFTGAEIELNSTCLCSQGKSEGEAVKYVTYIRNRFNGNVARIGSTCIDKFGEGNSIREEVNLLLPLMKNHSLRVNTELAELMTKQKVITPLELALIKAIGQKKKLEQDAIDTLSVLKAKIAIEKIPPSVPDIADWIHDFVDRNSENPEFISPYDNKKITVSRRIIDEYRELRKKLLIADANDYEKQTVIRVLGAFYSHNVKAASEPSKARPNIHKCQLDKLQVNECNADQMIEAAKLKVENYLESIDKKNTEEKETYTVLSVLLDAYYRFNKVPYNIDLLDGIQESIARLELEIEKLPSTISESLYRIETSLRDALHQNINEMESDIKQKHITLQQELQQVRDTLFHEFNNTVNDSKKLLGEVEAELKRLKRETNSLVAESTSRIQNLEESIWSTINNRNDKITALEEDIEHNQANVKYLNQKINSLEEDIENNQTSVGKLSREISDLTAKLEHLRTTSHTLFKAISDSINDTKKVLEDTRGRITQSEKNFRVIFLSMAIIVITSGVIYWGIFNRLDKLEREQQQRTNSVFPQYP